MKDHDARTASTSRRTFLRQACLGTLALEVGGGAVAASGGAASAPSPGSAISAAGVPPNMIGAYGPWAASILGDAPPALSFRRDVFTDVDAWRGLARHRLAECLASPDSGETPTAVVRRRTTFDGLDVEELSWQLPYGPPTQAVLLKPAGARGPLPGVLGLHDHGGMKYFGKRKITQTEEQQHPIIRAHREQAYGGVPWANALARRGYVVLVHDAYAFASRRVLPSDVPEAIRGGLADEDPQESEAYVNAYNRWAADHESVMAMSLLCAGTTWPGVFLGEDRRALDVLCARPEVDATRVGCGGLSGGGLRTVYLGGSDPRIQCAVCVGNMTTWRDFLLHKSWTHTWMTYAPLVPRELDFPEILGLRVPLPTMVLNDEEDGLFTLPEMKRADAILRAVYEKAGAGDHYASRFFPGPHKFDLPMQEAAFDWFDRFLG